MCLSRASRLPWFAYTGAAQVAQEGAAETAAIAQALFGGDLDAAIIRSSADATGAKCQQAVLKDVHKLYDTIWNAALAAKADALEGETGPAALDSADLQAAIFATLDAQQTPESKMAKAKQKLITSAATRCGETAQLATLFPGQCSASVTATELGACAAAIARCQFCRALNGFDGLSMECDLFDDDVANASCI